MKHGYGALLKRAMTARGMTSKALAQAASLDVSAIAQLRAGGALPLIETSARIADVLMWDTLHAYVIQRRTKQCGICDRTFVSNNKRMDHRVYCSTTCGAVGRRRRNLSSARKVTARRSAINADRLDRHQRAVAAYCWSCEPQGLCRIAECPLREVSPLPLAKESVA